MKEIIVQSLISSTQTAVMQDNKLVELLIEDNIHKKTKSNIYRGIVKNIKPGIEAAFVDIGFDKMAYLSLKSSDNIKNGTANNEKLSIPVNIRCTDVIRELSIGNAASTANTDATAILIAIGIPTNNSIGHATNNIIPVVTAKLIKSPLCI